jgi:O-antigen/teichoic acid export membrane protein
MNTPLAVRAEPAAKPLVLGRGVLSNAAVYSGASILEKLVSFILLPFYAHIFQTEGYGIIGLVDASVGLLTIAFAGGFHTAIVRMYYDEPRELRPRVFSTAVLVMLGLGLLVVPAPMLASVWLARILLGNPKYWILIVLSLATLVVDVSGKSASTYLVVTGRSVLYSSISLFRMVLAVFLNILLVLILRIGLVGIFISSLVTATVTAAIYVGVALGHGGLTFDRRIARHLCAFQFPLIPAEVIAFASRQTEGFLVRFLVSLAGVGVLEMAYKFPPMLNIFVVAPFMLSWRTKSVEIAAHPDAPRVMGRMLTGFLFLTLFGGLVLAVDIEPLLVLMTPQDFWGAARIARIEIVTTILAGLGTFMQFGLMYRKHTGRLAVIKTSVAFGKVAASFLIIKNFGLSGAAYSAAAMEAITLAWVCRASQSLYPIQFELKRVFALVACAAVLFLGIQHIDIVAGGPIGPVTHTVVPALLDVVKHSPLAAWRSGKLVTFLAGKDRVLAVLLVNTLAAMTYAVAVPILLPAVVRQVMILFRGRGPRS